jgi:hypothetical protein
MKFSSFQEVIDYLKVIMQLMTVSLTYLKDDIFIEQRLVNCYIFE